ncbi:la-related protein 1C-like isoform X2 [Syzygium oleosum]|uniref:la-related protein 1C-like isoform X2 n=1 Tax=Syzygium oleosum TaxID=219896 RepID=UPI0011D1AE1B|nr:la-related protein 1C-like isoform X2 [Syzygium oleosum]
MAIATDTTNANSIEANNHSPRNSAGAANSPRLGRPTRTAVSPQWNEIVRGETDMTESVDLLSKLSIAVAPEVVPSSSSSSLSSIAEEGSSDNGNVGKKTAWKLPSDSPGPAAAEFVPVMGADSWPALSESTRSSTKSTSVPVKGLSDGSSSVPVTEGNGNASSVSQKQLTDNKDANIATSSSVPARPRSKKQSGSTSSSGGVAQTSAIVSPSVDPRSNNPSARDHNHRSGPVSHSQNGNEHPQQQRSSLRHRSGGNYSRGDGPYQHNYGVRRDQERGNQELSGHRNFNNNRDSHMPQQRAAISRYGRPSAPPPIPPASAYIGPASVRPFGGPVVFPEAPVYYVQIPPMDLRNVPYYQPIQPHMVYLPPPNHLLHAQIVRQIEYYFSNENLVKDIYLRRQMDKQGWVSIAVIAGFKKVMELTTDVQLILDAVRNSAIVEVQAEKVRRRADWMRWVLSTSAHSSGITSPRFPDSLSHDTVASGIESVSLNVRDTRFDYMVGHADAHAAISRTLEEFNRIGETGQTSTAGTST